MYHTDLEHATLSNTTFRTVLHTSNTMQLVVMSLEPGQDIGMEIHDKEDQFIRIEQGT